MIVLALSAIVQFIKHKMVELLWNGLGEWLSDAFQFEHTVSKLNNTPGNRPNRLLNITEPFLPISGSIISIMAAAAAVFRSLFIIAFTWFFFTDSRPSPSIFRTRSSIVCYFSISLCVCAFFSLYCRFDMLFIFSGGYQFNVSILCHFPFYFQIFGSLSRIIITCIFAFTLELALLFVHVCWRHASTFVWEFLIYYIFYFVFLLCIYCQLFTYLQWPLQMIWYASWGFHVCIRVCECLTVECLTRCHPV